LDYLKIDGDFITSLPHSPVDQRMVKAMVDVARALGMQTIAEFVGDEPTLALLPRLGVDYAQGFHIGRPAPIEELKSDPSILKPDG
jgi:EAL domain-containing protein (putative c-di-GMP-specific phosphodiesterase class I)